MDIRLQKRQARKNYFVYYVNLPRQIIKKAKWIKRQKVVDVEVDLLGNIIIKPK